MTSDANFTVIFNSLLDEPLLAFLALFTRNALTSLKLHGFQVWAYFFFSFFYHPLGPFPLRIIICSNTRPNEQGMLLLKTEDCLGTDVLKVMILNKQKKKKKKKYLNS